MGNYICKCGIFQLESLLASPSHIWTSHRNHVFAPGPDDLLNSPPVDQRYGPWASLEMRKRPWIKTGPSIWSKSTCYCCHPYCLFPFFILFSFSRHAVLCDSFECFFWFDPHVLYNIIWYNMIYNIIYNITKCLNPHVGPRWRTWSMTWLPVSATSPTRARPRWRRGITWCFCWAGNLGSSKLDFKIYVVIYIYTYIHYIQYYIYIQYIYCIYIYTIYI